MIARIKGILSEIIDDYHVIVEVHGIFYEILVPAIVMNNLKDRFGIGEEIELSTLYEIDSAGGFGKMTPRLIGFLTDKEKKFFVQMVKVKDFGSKRAIKALVEPLELVANAIETADIKFLSTLPEIGKRSAEKIVAELKGKMTEFLSDDAEIDGMLDESKLPDFKRDALAALQQLGYKRLEANKMISRVLKLKPEIDQTDELIKEVFRHPRK